MAEFLVDKLLSALADVVLNKLQEEFKLDTGVKHEVKNLKDKLKIIRRMLQDVQSKKLKEKPVGIWLEKLEDVAYDVDDVLDEWNTEIQKLKLKADEDSNSPSPQMKKTVPKDLRNKVSSFLLSICSCFKDVSVRHDIAQKIKELNGRMNLIFQEADQFKFHLGDLNSNSEDFKRIITTSVFDESAVYGRESDKGTIVSKLLSDTSNANVCIISIVGTGGIGKTTLAQLAYNDNRVRDHFQLTKWVCVSDPFDEKSIARAILEDSEKSSPDVSELESLLQRIKALISGKKLLLVLDDVWTEDINKWEPICNSLKYGAPGSRILVTTRSARVARMMGTNYQHSLEELGDLDCWTILSRIALSGRSEKEFEKLKDIGLEISKRCKGLPLAAKFLGRLLQFKDTVKQWQDVLESEIWELEEASIDLFPHIYLSFKELSPEMKRCFLYCAVFPKDFRIDIQLLIRLWMAQGYLSSNGRAGNLESRGYECFSNLAMRSFFQNFVRDEDNEAQIISCKMHDMVHNFAKYLTNDECLIIKEGDGAKNSSCERVRHLLWLGVGDVDVSSIISNVEKLRSIYSNENVVTSDLKCVRVLSLQRSNLMEVPRAVANLSHLRFLDLSWNPLEILPEEICNLYNLETLDVSQCRDLTQFPQKIGKLINLRHLLNFSTIRHQQFSQGLEKLTSLRTLSEFKVGNGYSKFGYLKNLNQLEGNLWIEFYEVNEVDFDITALRDKTCIKRLTLDFYDSTQSNRYASLIESLQAPPRLERLRMNAYPNSDLPSWIVSLNNLTRLEIAGGKVASLPALGKLPALEVLGIKCLPGIEFLRHELLGITEVPPVPVPFPKLKILEFYELDNLKRWEDLREEDEKIVSAVMPCLQKLNIFGCRSLKKLPQRLLRRNAENDQIHINCHPADIPIE